MKRRSAIVGVILLLITCLALAYWGAPGQSTEVVRHSIPAQGGILASPPAALWQIREAEQMLLGRDYPAEWSKAGRVRVDVREVWPEVRGLTLGDRLALPVPQVGWIFEPVIDRIEEGPELTRSVRGLAEDQAGAMRRVVVTAGPTRVFAFIDTAEGPYELVANRYGGWLLPSSSMMASTDFSQPDYILRSERAK